MRYYYDDAGPGDRFRSKEFSSDQEALKWFEKLYASFRQKPCLLYDENFRTVKELRDGS